MLIDWFKDRIWGINSRQSGQWRNIQFSCNSPLQSIYFGIYTVIINFQFSYLLAMLRKHVELHLKMHRAHFKLIFNWFIYHFKIWSVLDFQICQIWLTTQLTTCSVYIYTGSNQSPQTLHFQYGCLISLTSTKRENPLIPFIWYMNIDNKHTIKTDCVSCCYPVIIIWSLLAA